MGMIHLSIPYDKKDYFKKKYKKEFLWNPKGKFWYWHSHNLLPDDLKPFLHIGLKSKKNSPVLTLELVPRSCWLSNVRNHVTRQQWKMIRQKTFKPAKYTCEICGGQGDEEEELVECHEVFQYDDRLHVQRLIKFMALCPDCHMVKHYGLACKEGMESYVLAHLCKINSWEKKEGQKYVEAQFDLWLKRSRVDWQLDLTFLRSSFGITVQGEDSAMRRRRAESFYDESYGDDYYEFPRGPRIATPSIKQITNHLFYGGPDCEETSEFMLPPQPVPASDEWLKLLLGSQKYPMRRLLRWLELQIMLSRIRYKN